MLNQSQPIDPKYYELFNGNSESLDYADDMIISQSIGKMFESLRNDNGKINIGLRLNWLWRDITKFFYDIKWAIRNHFKWRKIIRNLRPWKGFHGLITVMQTHLRDYIEIEEKYGHTEEEYENGGSSSGGDFIEQGKGWAGSKGGKEPQEGYF